MSDPAGAAEQLEKAVRDPGVVGSHASLKLAALRSSDRTRGTSLSEAVDWLETQLHLIKQLGREAYLAERGDLLRPDTRAQLERRLAARLDHELGTRSE